MKSITINGSKREHVGKVATKALRNAGKVPCVIYGGEKPIHFSAEELAFSKLVYTADAHTVVVVLEDGTKTDAVLQDIQFHPVTDKILHIDFFQLHEGKEISMIIPVKVVGTAPGVKDQGGNLSRNKRKLTIRALPKNLPDFFNPSKFNILHAGNMMSARNPKGLIKAFQLFLEEHSEAKEVSNLLFIGNSSVFDDFIKEQQNLTQQLFLSSGSMPYNQVLTMQYHAAVNVILEAKGAISPFLPGKFPHCVQANKPILLLGPHYSEAKRLLGDGYKFWSEIDDVNSIKNCIKILFNNWKHYNRDVRLDRKDLETYMSSGYLKQQL